MTCKHHAENPEGIVWPVEVSLDHFDNCLDHEARLMTWRMTRQLADQAGRCLREDHTGALDYLRSLHRPRPIRQGRAYRRRAMRRTRSRR